MNKGFGTVRILLYLTVTGVLFLIAIPNFLSTPCNPYQSEAKKDLGNIAKRLEGYFAENGVFTSDLDELWFQPQDTDRYRYEIRLSPDKQEFEIIASSKKMTIPAFVGENEDVWTLDEKLMMNHPVSNCSRNVFYDFGIVFLYALACIVILEILYMLLKLFGFVNSGSSDQMRPPE